MLDRAYEHYLRIDRSPSRAFDAGLTALRPLIGPDRVRGLERRLSTLRLPLDPLGPIDGPPIELLMVATQKDFPILPASIASALGCSLNPISKVVVVTPSNCVDQVGPLLKDVVDPDLLSVIDEDSLLEDDLRAELRAHFSARYGWILQQFLCLAYVSGSRAAGVLVLDSDTLLTRKRLFLAGGRQILTPSLERHQPYYDFLRNLSPLFGSEDLTFVSHHMLWQPSVLNEILEIVCEGQLKVLADKVVAGADMGQASPLCVKYELYSHGLLALHADRAVLAKWSNTSASRAQTTRPVMPHVEGTKYEKYASVSCHDYV